MQAFEYYEIWPCIDTGEETICFQGEISEDDELGKILTPRSAQAEAEAYQAKHGTGKPFWTIYGRAEGLATAIGDFKSFEAALTVLDAILAPLAYARDIIDSGENPKEASYALDDIINQSTNERRL